MNTLLLIAAAVIMSPLVFGGAMWLAKFFVDEDNTVVPQVQQWGCALVTILAIAAATVMLTTALLGGFAR